MSPAQRFFILLDLFLVFSSGDAFFGYYLFHCQFNSNDGHDVVYLEQYYFNKKLEVQYNSTTGKVVGYTKNSKEIADGLNKNKEFIRHQLWKTNVCKNASKIAYKELLKPVAPYVWVRSAKAEQSKHSHMLVCSAYDFYPKQIKVRWLRNGNEVTSDVTSTDQMPNGNWLYQLHSYLEFKPKPGEKISCMVEHASFMEPMFYDWEPEPDSSINLIAVGSVGLLLGLLFSVGGFIYNKKKSAGRVTVPTDKVQYPEENL